MLTEQERSAHGQNHMPVEGEGGSGGEGAAWWHPEHRQDTGHPVGTFTGPAQVRDSGREGSAVTGTGEEPEADTRAGVTDSGRWTPGRFVWDVLKDRGLSCPGPSELGPGKSRAVTELWGPRGRDTAVALPGPVRSSGQGQVSVTTCYGGHVARPSTRIRQ